MTIEKSENSGKDFLKPINVKESPTKLVKITDTLKPEVVDTNFGKKLRLSIEMDGKEYTWTPNNTTRDSIIDELSDDESKWTGKEILLGTIRGQTGQGMGTIVYTKKYIDEDQG